MLRIALVIDRFDASRGGGESYTVCLGKLLAGRGHQVHVFANSWTDVDERLQFHHLPIVTFPRWAKVLTFALAARRALRHMKFDVIQGFGGVPLVDVHRPGGGAEMAWLVQEIRSRDKGIDRVVTAASRMLSPKLLLNLTLERLIYASRPLPMVVANSHMVRTDILKFHRSIDPNRIRVVENGVDTNRFHPKNRQTLGRQLREELSLTAGTLVILFMAHNFRLKGLHVLIRALGRASQMKGWMLLVAGRGKKKAFNELAVQHRIGDKIKFVDHVRQPEAFFAAGDLLVHPTFYDPFSNVCLEAMASGLPVITTRNNGASEILREDGSGYVIRSPVRYDELWLAIRQLWDFRRRSRVGEEARAAAERLSWNTHLHRLESLYREVLEAKRKAAPGLVPSNWTQ